MDSYGREKSALIEFSTMHDVQNAKYSLAGEVALRHVLEMNLDTFWAVGEAEGEKIVRISLFYHRRDICAYLKRRGGAIGQSCAILECLEKDLFRYVQGEKVSLVHYPLEMDSYSSFSTTVWALAQEIPYGEVCSYKRLSEEADTKAYRAVGTALSRNPFPLLVPCHRVIRNNGDLGGYSAGQQLKKKLLRIEGVLQERESYLVSRKRRMRE